MSAVEQQSATDAVLASALGLAVESPRADRVSVGSSPSLVASVKSLCSAAMNRGKIPAAEYKQLLYSRGSKRGPSNRGINREAERHAIAQEHARMQLIRRRVLRLAASEGSNPYVVWLTPRMVTKAEQRQAQAIYAAADAATEAAHAHLGHNVGGSLRTFYTDLPDLLRIEVEINLGGSGRDLDGHKARWLKKKLSHDDIIFLLHLDVNTGDIQLFAFAGKQDQKPVSLLRSQRLFGVFQPKYWGQDGRAPPYAVYVREDGGWVCLCLAKAVLGHQPVLYNDGGYSGGMISDNGKLPHVLVLNLSVDDEDKLVAETMVNALNFGKQGKFVHLEHIESVTEFERQLKAWGKEPNNITHLPGFLQRWVGKLDCSFDFEEGHKHCFYVPPVVVVFAHGDEEHPRQVLSSRGESRSFYPMDTLSRALQLLLHTHCPPHLFVFNVCFGGGSSSGGSDSLAAFLAKELFPIPFIAYRGAVTFADLLLGHPFVLLCMLSVLYRPLADMKTKKDFALYRRMISTNVSGLAHAFRLAVAMSPPSSGAKAIMFNAIDPFKEINRARLWKFWHMSKFMHEGKLTWYSIIALSATNGALIVPRPLKAPVLNFELSSKAHLPHALWMQQLQLQQRLYFDLAERLIDKGIAYLRRGNLVHAEKSFKSSLTFIDCELGAKAFEGRLEYMVCSKYGAAASLLAADGEVHRWDEVHSLVNSLQLTRELRKALREVQQRLPALRDQLAKLISERAQADLNRKLDARQLLRCDLSRILDRACRLYKSVTEENLPWKGEMSELIKKYVHAPPQNSG